MFAMDESPANREGKNRAQGNEEQEDDDYMGDLSQFLPSDALFPPKLFSSKKVTSSFPVLPLKDFYSLKESKRYTTFNESHVLE